MPEQIPDDVALTSAALAGGGEVSLLHRFHSVMRGRYHWAILLGSILAAGAGYVGYRSVTLEYSSTGLVQVQRYSAPLLYNTETTGSLPMYESYLAGQIQILKSPRVVDMAMDSEAWRAVGRGIDPEAQSAFRSAIGVWNSQGSEFVNVSFRDPDPKVAQTGVQAVLEAFERISSEGDRQRDQTRMMILEERRNALTRESASLQDQVRTFGDATGPDGVEFRYETKAQQLRTLEETIAQDKARLASLEKRLEAGDYSNIPVEQASEDPEVIAARNEVESLQRSLDGLYARGMKSEHRQVRMLGQQLEAAEKRLRALNPLVTVEGGADDTARRAILESVIADQKTMVAEREGLLEEVKASMVKISEQRTRLHSLREQASEVESKLDQVRARLEALNFESTMSERVHVRSYGEVNRDPVNESQRTQMAAAGGLGGFMLGFCLVGATGLINPRFRHSQDLRLAAGGPPTLGMLPFIPEEGVDADHAMYAGHCIHQVRMLLQLEADEAASQAMVITGPVSGTGKTSLTMALGLSFAAAGSKTLMIDFDMIGGGLTRRFRASRHRRLGELLAQYGIVKAEDVETVAREMAEPGTPLGARLVQRQLASADDVERVVALQREHPLGVLDVLRGDPLEHCVTPLDMPGLDILAIGGATADHVGAVGRVAVANLFRQAKAQYDIVLIDTGPVPGSVETSLVAAQADAAVVVVSRGDSVSQAKNCLDFLRTINARIAGIVYNRADRDDVERSNYSGSASMRSRPQDQEDGDAPAGSATSGRRSWRLGPLAASVVRPGRGNGRNPDNGNGSSNGNGNGHG